MLKFKPKSRLFVERPLEPGADLAIGGDQAHYLVHVMRAQPGDNLLLFNGADGEWISSVTNTGKNRCLVSVEVQTRAQRPEQGPWLAFAPIKKSAVDFIAEKATELGVSRLCPVFTSRTAVNRVNVRRLRANAVEAAEQSGRLTVPDVADPVAFDDLLSHWPSERTLFVLHGGGQGQPIFERFSEVRSTSEERRALPPGFLIGPEGGFPPSEVDLIARRPFVSVVEMGPRTLRCETAALSALACWQAIAGDWRQPPYIQESRP